MELMASENALSQSKLLVHVAENGYTFEIECDPSMKVERLQQRLQVLSGVHINYQVLICGAVQLQTNNTLDSYDLPYSGFDVFLYNRFRLIASSERPAMEDFDVPEPAIPPVPSSSHPFDSSPDPALKALPSYERQFESHYYRGRAMYVISHNMIQICNELLKRLRVQDRALENATCNMDHSYKMINQMYVEFMNQNAKKKKMHIYYLSIAEKNIEKLRHCMLHPALQTQSRKSLLDIAGEANLRGNIKACSEFLKQFQTIVSQLKVPYTEIKRNFGTLCAKHSVKIQEMEDAMKKWAGKIEEQAMITKSLSNDLKMVTDLMLKCQQQRLSHSLRPHDAVCELGPLYEIHVKNYLPKMEGYRDAIHKLFEFYKAKKHEMNLDVHRIMQKVASLQSCIRNLRDQLRGFKEAMKHQDTLFGKVNSDCRIGPSYRACLAEVIRRKAQLKLYSGQVGQLAEKMARLREMEVSKREDFLKRHSPSIPQEIFESLGLFDLPSQCVVDLMPFDGKLLDIDISELEFYAPESLISLLPKDHSTLQGRSSDSSYASSYFFGGSDPCKVYDFDAVDEECNSDEIIGTSKLEVENAWLRAELASAIAIISSLDPVICSDVLDGSSIDYVLQETAKRTANALHLKSDHIKHIQKILKEKERQCTMYEEKIKDLEQRLCSEEQLLKNSLSDERAYQSSILNEIELKDNDCQSQPFGLQSHEIKHTTALREPMDEGCTTQESAEECIVQEINEGVDENTSDFSGPLFPDVNAQTTRSDGSLFDLKGHTSEGNLETMNDQECLVNNQSHDVRTDLKKQIGVENNLTFAQKYSIVIELQKALEEKTQECAVLQEERGSAREAVNSVSRELEVSLKLLDESQMNCAHLENCLHEAREEAQTNLCAADRRAKEYNTVCASSVKLRALLERLRGCISAPVGTATGFPESLRSFALSLASVANSENEDGTIEFRTCIRALAEKVGYLVQERAELLDKCSRAESAHRRASMDLERQSDLVKSLYAKNKMERQVNKEKISFTRFEVQELAAFVRNSAGQYEAINRNCKNYYLSDESIALFVDNIPSAGLYIIGQIVHIERNVAREPSSSTSSSFRYNPYSLPIGTEYFVVTVAMVPDTIQSTHP